MSSRVTGVDHHQNKWRARIRDGGGRRTLGHFATEREAVEALRDASPAMADRAARGSHRTPVSRAKRTAREPARTPVSRAKRAARGPPRTLDDPWFDGDFNDDVNDDLVEADVVEFFRF